MHGGRGGWCRRGGRAIGRIVLCKRIVAAGVDKALADGPHTLRIHDRDAAETDSPLNGHLAPVLSVPMSAEYAARTVVIETGGPDVIG